jgi:hypothetical protein
MDIDPSQNMWLTALPGNITYGEPVSGINAGILAEVDLLYTPKISIGINCTVDLDYRPCAENLAALRGVLQVCINTYETSIVNGSTSTQLIGSNTDPHWDYIKSEDAMHDNNGLYRISANGSTFELGDGALQSLAMYLTNQTLVGSVSYMASREACALDVSACEFDTDMTRALASDLWGSLYQDTTPDKAVIGLRNRLANISTAITNR